MTTATRSAVHTSPVNPYAGAPRANSVGSCARCSALSRRRHARRRPTRERLHPAPFTRAPQPLADRPFRDSQRRRDVLVAAILLASRPRRVCAAPRASRPSVVLPCPPVYHRFSYLCRDLSLEGQQECRRCFVGENGCLPARSADGDGSRERSPSPAQPLKKRSYVIADVWGTVTKYHPPFPG